MDDTYTNNTVPDATSAYFSQIGKYSVLTEEEEKDLITRAQNGDKEAYDKLVKHNLRLVVSVAKHYYKNTTMSLLDLIQEGNIGLIKAIPKFDFNKGCKFSTFITPWIRQSISRAVTNQPRTIRIPSNKMQLIKKIKNYINTVSKSADQKPSIEEISKELEIEESDIIELLPYINECISLDHTLDSDEDSVLSDLIPDENTESPESIVLRKDDRDIILKVLDTLNEKEKDVIIMRFGLDGNIPLTLEEVGKNLDVTKERIRQIESNALRKLRHPSRANILKTIA